MLAKRELSCALSRVTRFGIFSPFVRFFWQFFKNLKSNPYFRLLFNTSNFYVSILPSFIMGDCFTNSSGHPGFKAIGQRVKFTKVIHSSFSFCWDLCLDRKLIYPSTWQKLWLNVLSPTVKLPNAKLPNAKLQTVKLLNAKLPTVKLPNAKLPNAKLPNAKLPNAKLPNAKLPTVKLPNPKLPTVKLPNAKLPTVKLPNAKIPKAKIPNAKLPSCHQIVDH
jgi:hypothetical protein